MFSFLQFGVDCNNQCVKLSTSMQPMRENAERLMPARDRCRPPASGLQLPRRGAARAIDWPRPGRVREQPLAFRLVRDAAIRRSGRVRKCEWQMQRQTVALPSRITSVNTGTQRPGTVFKSMHLSCRRVGKLDWVLPRAAWVVLPIPRARPDRGSVRNVLGAPWPTS